MKTDSGTVDEYLAAQPEGACGALARVRAAIRKALPGSDEVISYKIPTYKLLGKASATSPDGSVTIRSIQPLSASSDTVRYRQEHDSQA